MTMCIALNRDGFGLRLAPLRKSVSTRTSKFSLSARLELRPEQIECLSPKPEQQPLSIIDSFIAADAHRSAQSRPGSRS